MAKTPGYLIDHIRSYLEIIQNDGRIVYMSKEDLDDMALDISQVYMLPTYARGIEELVEDIVGELEEQEN